MFDDGRAARSRLRLQIRQFNGQDIDHHGLHRRSVRVIVTLLRGLAVRETQVGRVRIHRRIWAHLIAISRHRRRQILVRSTSPRRASVCRKGALREKQRAQQQAAHKSSCYAGHAGSLTPNADLNHDNLGEPAIASHQRCASFSWS